MSRELLPLSELGVVMDAVVVFANKRCEENYNAVANAVKEYAAKAIQAAKPEQAQTAVGLPEPWHMLDLQDGNPDIPLFHETQMDEYATAKTAEAVRELVEALEDARNYIDAVVCNSSGKKQNNYMGCLNRIDSALTKYASKKEQSNG